MRTGDEPQGAPRRLEALASLVPRGSRVADVGTGHARLPLLLLATRRARFAVAIDLRAHVLDRLSVSRESGSLRKRLVLRVGDGLQALRDGDDVDVVIVSGLGGRTILELLDGPQLARSGADRLVLQPQSEGARVRAWLCSAGWAIVSERMAFERGRFYAVIAAEQRPGWALPEHPTLGREEQLLAGPCLARSADDAVRCYWRHEVARLSGLARSISSLQARADLARRTRSARRILAALPAPPGAG